MCALNAPQAALASYNLVDRAVPRELQKLRGSGTTALAAAAGGGPAPEARCVAAALAHWRDARGVQLDLSALPGLDALSRQVCSTEGPPPPPQRPGLNACSALDCVRTSVHSRINGGVYCW